MENTFSSIGYFAAKGKLLLLVFCMLSGLETLQAQKVWTLRDCIDQALKGNISLQQQNLQLQSARADAWQSKMNALPSLNAQATNNWQTGFNINPKTNLPEENLAFRTNSMGVSASMPLFNGFQSSNTIRLRESDYKAGRFDLENIRNTISLNVANAYLNVMQRTEALEAALSQRDATLKQVERQQKLFDLGGLNKVKLLQVKAQLASEEMNVVSAQGMLNQAYLDLWQLVNVVPDSSYRVARTDAPLQVEDEPRTLDAIYAGFENQSPDVQAAGQRLRSADLQRYIALGGRSPRLSITGSLSSFYTTLNTQGVGTPVITQIPIGVDKNNDPVYTFRQSYPNSETVAFDDQFKKNLGSSLGLTLTLPIFNGWNVNTNVFKSGIQQENAKLNDKQVRQNLYKSISQAYLSFKTAVKRYEAAQNMQDAAKESYTASETQFELGALNVSDYLAAKNNYTKAQTDLLQARYEVMFRRKVLDFYLGKTL